METAQTACQLAQLSPPKTSCNYSTDDYWWIGEITGFLKTVIRAVARFLLRTEREMARAVPNRNYKLKTKRKLIYFPSIWCNKLESAKRRKKYIFLNLNYLFGRSLDSWGLREAAPFAPSPYPPRYALLSHINTRSVHVISLEPNKHSIQKCFCTLINKSWKRMTTSYVSKMQMWSSWRSGCSNLETKPIIYWTDDWVNPQPAGMSLIR